MTAERGRRNCSPVHDAGSDEKESEEGVRGKLKRCPIGMESGALVVVKHVHTVL